MYASYPGETVDNLMTAGVQWLTSKLTGSNVSSETAGKIETTAGVIIMFASKGKGGRSATKGLENPFKNKTIGEANKAMKKQVKTGKLEKVYEDPISGSKAYKNKSGYS